MTAPDADVPEYPFRARPIAGTIAIVSARTTTPAALRHIPVLVIDDHSAPRTALRRLLDDEPAVRCMGTLSHADGLPAATIERMRLDVRA